jgi:hypothetical protein
MCAYVGICCVYEYICAFMYVYVLSPIYVCICVCMYIRVYISLVGYLTTLSVLTLCSVDGGMMNECGAVGGMRIDRGNRCTWIKPSPMPLYHKFNMT